MARSRRDQSKEGFWRRMLREQRRSGLSGRAWFQRRGLRECNLYWWRRELARRDAEGRTFAPVQVIADAAVDTHTSAAADTNGSSPGRIEIWLPDARRVHVVGPVERQMLIEVLALLGIMPASRSASEGLSYAGPEGGGC